jgi:hypothetical protein
MADQTYNRIELAREQLDIALSLFLKRKSFVSALTLAPRDGQTRTISGGVGQSLDTERADSRRNEREAASPVDAVAGEQPNTSSVVPHNHTEAVVLDFVNPVGASGGLATGTGRHGSMKPAGGTRAAMANITFVEASTYDDASPS